MAESTGIGWCDATMNPWVGCEKVSPGCAHCYAETLVTGRMGRAGTWGAGGTRERTSESNWKKPLRWERLAQEGKLPDGSENPDGHRPRVFCASLADVFEPRPELDPWRDDLFDLIAATPSLDWLLLTKRPESARDWLRDYHDHYKDTFAALVGVSDAPLHHLDLARKISDTFATGDWAKRDGSDWAVLPNLWIGTSIENSRHAWRADALREIPAAVRFISAEPLLGSLFTLPEWRPVPCTCGAKAVGRTCSHDCASYANAVGALDRRPLELDGIDWMIVGGESGGRDARPMHPAWVRELRDAIFWNGMTPCGDGCCEPPAPWERPAFYFKQWGSWIDDTLSRDSNAVWVDRDGRARSPLAADAYDDLPDGSMRMRYAGPSPKAGGKRLDGIEWCEFPRVTVHA